MFSFLKYSLLCFVATVVTSFILCGQSTAAIQYIESHASHVPKKHSKSIKKLTSYLTEPFDQDVDKIRSIYTWIGKNIKYDDRELRGSDYSYNFIPEEVFKQKRGVCTGYSILFNQMSELAGIKSITISGYSKNNRTSEVNRKEPDHTWNAVLIENSWHLLDVTWDAGLWRSENINSNDLFDRYFLAEPSEFIKDHLPAQPMWQLISQPISLDEFVDNGIVIVDSISSSQQFDFNQAIRNHLNRPRALQRIDEYKTAYTFNPTTYNGELMGHGLIDYAGILADSLESAENEQTNDILIDTLHHQIIALCSEGQSLIDFHNWQAQLCGNIYLSSATRAYNQILSQDAFSQEAIHDINQKVSISIDILSSIDDKFWSQSGLEQANKLSSLVSKLSK